MIQLLPRLANAKVLLLTFIPTMIFSMGQTLQSLVKLQQTLERTAKTALLWYKSVDINRDVQYVRTEGVQGCRV